MGAARSESVKQQGRSRWNNRVSGVNEIGRGNGVGRTVEPVGQEDCSGRVGKKESSSGAIGAVR